MWLDDLLDNTKMRMYEELSRVWTFAYVSNKCNYNVYILGGEDKQVDYACIRYLNMYNVIPKNLISINEKQIQENVGETLYPYGIKLISVADFKDIVTVKDLVISTLHYDFTVSDPKFVNLKHRIRNRKPYIIPNELLWFCDLKDRITNFSDVQFMRRETGSYIELALENRNELNELYDMLEDEISKKTLIEVIRAGINNDVFRYIEYDSDDKYFALKDELYKHLEDEVWLNCGSATGDTILRFFHSNLKCKKILAYEADTKQISRLKTNLSFLPLEESDMVEIHEEFLNESTKFNDDPTLINMDIEGAEINTLEALRGQIERSKPVCAICAYHEAEHLLKIPQFFTSISSDWHFFLRKYVGYNSSALNEYVIYAIPESRMIYSMH